MIERRAIADIDALGCHVAAREFEVADAFLADEVQLRVRVLRLQLFEPAPGFTDQIGIERAAQAAIRRDQQ